MEQLIDKSNIIHSIDLYKDVTEIYVKKPNMDSCMPRYDYLIKKYKVKKGALYSDENHEFLWETDRPFPYNKLLRFKESQFNKQWFIDKQLAMKGISKVIIVNIKPLEKSIKRRKFKSWKEYMIYRLSNHQTIDINTYDELKIFYNEYLMHNIEVNKKYIFIYDNYRTSFGEIKRVFFEGRPNCV